VTVEAGLRERKKQQTRQLIADTARRLFGERGFESVSVAEIARTADVAEATVFNYFPTKEDLVFSGLDRFEAELLDSVRNRPAGESALAAFSQFITTPRGFLTDTDEREAASKIQITKFIAASPALLAREQQIFAGYTRSLARLLAEQTHARPSDVRPYVAAKAMIGIHEALITFVRQRLLDGETNRPKLRRDLVAAGRAATALLAAGLEDYATSRPRTTPTGAAIR
jgi:AcrR family transcriptional regulator